MRALRVTVVMLVLAITAAGTCVTAVAQGADIWTAASEGDIAAIKEHTSADVDVNAKKQDARGQTPLHLAAAFGQAEAAGLLIQLGADVNARSNDGSTPLHQAALFGRTGIVKLLLEKGARIDVQNARFQAPTDTVARPWGPQLERMYGWFQRRQQIKLDLEKIKAARPEIAALFDSHAGAHPAPEAAEKEVWNYPTIVLREIAMWSDGTRLSGVLLYPKDRKEGEKLPAIVLCNGWGGTKATLLFNGIAPRFAAAGYVVINFDYRGWGDSDSRLVVRGEMPGARKGGDVTVTAQAIREVVDPFDQQEDIDAAISYVYGEPMVDTQRIGIWGTSFGGGHVIYRAAHDRRIACVVAQVGGQAADWTGQYPDRLKGIYKQKSDRARGLIDPMPQGERASRELRGSPHMERISLFFPGTYAHWIKVPTLMIDAENEHYYDIKENADRVLGILKKNGVPTEYHVLKGIGHYDIYRGKPLDDAMEIEIAWFNTQLKDDK